MRLGRALIATCLLVTSLIAASQAQAVASSERFTISTQAFSQCTGEVIDVELELHVVNVVQTDAQGITHQGTTVIALFRGTSASGARYIGGSHRTEEIRHDSNVEMTFTTTSHLFLTRLGEDGTADDLRARILVHFAHNANGELVVEKVEFFEECRWVVGAPRCWTGRVD